MPPLSLSDRQLRLLQNAVRSVPFDRRDAFVRGVASHLCSEPSDHAVSAAINAQLDLIPSKQLNLRARIPQGVDP